MAREIYSTIGRLQGDCYVREADRTVHQFDGVYTTMTVLTHDGVTYEAETETDGQAVFVVPDDVAAELVERADWAYYGAEG